jgi:integrase
MTNDPAVLLRNYAKRKRKQTANTSMLPVINALTSGNSET